MSLHPGCGVSGLTREVDSLQQLCCSALSRADQLYHTLYLLPSDLIEPVLEYASLLHKADQDTLNEVRAQV